MVNIVNVKTPLKGQRLRDPFQEPISALKCRKIDYLNKILDWLDYWQSLKHDTGHVSFLHFGSENLRADSLPSSHVSKDLLLYRFALRAARTDWIVQDRSSFTIGVETRPLSRASRIDRLKTKRSARRAQNTKILQEARLLLADPTVDKSKLSGIFDRLSASNNELLKLNDALEEHIADDELEAEYATAAEYIDQAISMLAEIRCKIAALERADSTAETASQNPSPTVPHAMPRIGPRLPNLDMPTFKGDIHKWAAFWEQFEQTVHLNNDISTTSQFFYLRHYLAGEAAAAIAGLPTSEACCADAVELLKERFRDRK
ncbi:hypothetical protein HPB49_004081 [Dermacentor silvarum]|uniref:Uncharacterized protein n=1 Tax=Dermacentor silvarum TaxID=543639 RepID=A0ACB8D2T4_DERSI|nr:hypothetical protein HPB49_004081 [Dermacentor silvarum]